MLGITITVNPGHTREGVMLAINQDRMRVALQGDEDTIELCRLNGVWTTDTGEPVELEALLLDGQAGEFTFLEAPARVAAAGRA